MISPPKISFNNNDNVVEYSTKDNAKTIAVTSPEIISAPKTIAILERISTERNEQELGAVHEVLIEEIHENEGEYNCKGRTATNKIVHFTGVYQPGNFVSVRITRANPHSLYGEGIV